MRRALLLALIALAGVRAPDAGALVNAGSLALPIEPRAIAVSGDRAYVAISSGPASTLLVVDLSDPDAPAEVAALALGHPPFDVEVVGDHAYLSLGNPGSPSGLLAVVDVSDPSAPALISELATGAILGGSGDLEVAGGVAYLVTGGSLGPRGEPVPTRLELIDVADPSSPTALGSLDLPLAPAAIDVAGERVFVANTLGVNGGALQVIDASSPRAPVEIARVPTQLPVSEIAVRDGLAYLSSPFGIEVFDVSDLSHPAPLGLHLSFSFDFAGGDVALKDGIAYLSNGSGLRAVDVRDPAQPRPAGGIATDATSFEIGGGFAYAIGPSELRVIDLSRPAYPLELGATAEPAGASDVAVEAGQAYVVGSGGLHVVDVSDPTAPVGLGSLAIAQPAIEVAVAGPLAFVAAGSAGLRVADVSDPTAPALLGAFATPGRATDVELADGLAYVATVSPTALHVVDASDPRSPRELGSLAVAPSCGGGSLNVARVAVAGGVAHLLCRFTLYTIDVTDPTAPVSIASRSRPPGLGGDVALLGDVAYLGLVGRIEGIDVSDPAMPSGPTFSAPLAAERIEVADGFLLVSGRTGLRVLDAIDPFAVRDLGGILEAGLGAAVADGRVYLAAGSGLRIFDLGPEYLREIAAEVRIGTGTGRDPVNPRSRGVLNVALQGSEELDLAQVDPATLVFGPGRAPVVHVAPGRGAERDGFRVLHLQFRTEQTGIAPATSEACLRGETFAGRRLVGCVALATVPAPAKPQPAQLPAPERGFRARR